MSRTPLLPQPWRGRVDGGDAEIRPDKDRPHAAMLRVNGLQQSHVDLLDPTYLGYEYTRHIGDVLDLAFPERMPLDVLHLGGGALTLPRYVAATRPRSRQRVVELDAQLVALVRERLPLPARSGIKVAVGEAGQALESARAAAHDAIVLDAYADPHMPSSLVRRDTFVRAAAALRPTGVLLVNLADGKPLSFARAMVATIGDVVTFTGVIADASVLRGRRFGNLVVVASATEPPWDDLRRRLAGGPFPGRLVVGSDLARFTSGARLVYEPSDAPRQLPPTLD